MVGPAPRPYVEEVLHLDGGRVIQGRSANGRIDWKDHRDCVRVLRRLRAFRAEPISRTPFPEFQTNGSYGSVKVHPRVFVKICIYPMNHHHLTGFYGRP